MPRKRTFSEAEIDELAAHLMTVWKPGETIRPWLRKHAALIRELVHDDRSWDAMARAMTRADILFATGKPWTGHYLTIEFAKATAALKGYPSRRKPKAVSGQAAPEPPHDFAVSGAEMSVTSAIPARAEPAAPEKRTIPAARMRPKTPAVQLSPEEEARMRAIDERLYPKRD